MRTAVAFAATVVLSVTSALAQPAPGVQASTGTPPPAAAASSRSWSFGVAVNTYFVPDEANFAQPVITADRGRLHLETRYHYEAAGTGSIWAGVNFGGGDTVAWTITPMFGGVIGDTDGVAPGYKGSLAWRKLEFYSEGEYVFDAHDSSSSFLYNWSELSWAPVEAFRIGMVTDRTRVYHTDREVQRGILVGGSFRRLTVTAYAFNPDDAKPFYVLSVGFAF
jgi:hypothetical protein